MSIERITAPDPVNADEAKEEETLRPHDFKSHIGQERIKKNLGLAITAAKQRGDAVDHVLLYGPPGLGKTTMAWIIGREMNVNVRVTSGPAIERSGDLASLMTNLTDNDVLFIDEIHRLNRTVEEVLYSAMEDFKLDIMLGKGPSARSLRLDLPKFTLVGATTRVGGLSAPLRDRFGIIHRFEFYEPGEIQQIINRAARILGIEIDDAATALIAQRSRLTPRIALRLLRRVRDYAQVAGQKRIEDKHAIGALKMLEIDEHGLDESDRRILRAIIENYGGGPVGVETLAALTSEERSTIEDFHEPFLMQIGLLERTPRGRKTTPKAHKHFGKNTNSTQPGQASLL